MLDKQQQQAIINIAIAAGERILTVVEQDWNVVEKDDRTPVTEADFQAHNSIVNGLDRLPEALPILSEEGDDPLQAHKEQWPAYWLVDPLDGTKEFIAGNGEYTVNIALIEGEQATFGVVYAPAKQTLYWGGANYGTYRCTNITAQQNDVWQQAQQLTVRTPGALITTLGSRRHGGAIQDKLLKAVTAHFGEVREDKLGSSLKLCRVAEGQADIYPRFGPTSEWDIAAGQAVLEGAGGRVWCAGKDTLRYRRADIINPNFLALGGTEQDWQWLDW